MNGEFILISDSIYYSFDSSRKELFFYFLVYFALRQSVRMSIKSDIIVMKQLKKTQEAALNYRLVYFVNHHENTSLQFDGK